MEQKEEEHAVYAWNVVGQGWDALWPAAPSDQTTPDQIRPLSVGACVRCKTWRQTCGESCDKALQHAHYGMTEACVTSGIGEGLCIWKGWLGYGWQRQRLTGVTFGSHWADMRHTEQTALGMGWLGQGYVRIWVSF